VNKSLGTLDKLANIFEAVERFWAHITRSLRADSWALHIATLPDGSPSQASEAEDESGLAPFPFLTYRSLLTLQRYPYLGPVRPFSGILERRSFQLFLPLISGALILELRTLVEWKA
jgi:hypothetical protein